MNTSSDNDYELIIIGAGAYGCTLAQFLVDYKYHGRVLLLEQKDKLPQKRWCFWSTQSLPDFVTTVIEKKWEKWSISQKNKVALHNHPQYQYCAINSADYFAQFEVLCNQSKLISINKAESVQSVDTLEDFIEVKTLTNTYTCKRLIDTRPPIVYLDYMFTTRGMFQCFVGYELEFELDTFDDNQASIMHQLEANKLGVNFIYILPFTKRRALIEYTTFSITPVQHTELQRSLDSYLQTMYSNASFECFSEEAGTLPMFNLKKRSVDARIDYGGVAGGAMRASTGYSFLTSICAAQKQAEELVRTNKLVKSDPIAKKYRLMDEIMLRVLINEPEAAACIFYTFSSGVSSSTYAKFMTERATILDLLKVISVMPKKPFIKACWQVLYENLRRK